MNLNFRTLTADEIEVRVAMCKENGISLLLYKNARVDMQLLDEVVGAANWQRHHSRDNANCIISIWDDEKSQWIEKEDTGTESNTEAQKGLASDSFKRAGFNWGIGRELYTAPFIWVTSDNAKIKTGKDKYGNTKYECKDSFSVKLIEYDENRRISKLQIYNETQKCIAYTLGTSEKPKKKAETKDIPVYCDNCGIEMADTTHTDGSFWALKDVITFSQGRFNGKIYCKDCMTGFFKK